MNPTIIECFNPATGEKLGEVAALSPAEVDAAVARAHVAQQAWAQTSFAKRRAVFTTLLRTILDHMDAICAAVVQDGGKTFENAALGEVMTSVNKIRWLIKNGERYLKPEKVSQGGPLLHKKGHIEYRPLGVVAAIVPWNYPFQNIFASFADPLMAGNAVVLKASEAVAWSTQLFQQLINSVFDQHGISRDTVQILNGYGATGAALVRADVQKILFIGSVANGRRIVADSAQRLTPTVMELGGKDPLIVCDDADIDRAVHSALGGPDGQIGHERGHGGQRPAHRDTCETQPAGLVGVVQILLHQKPRPEHRNPGEGGDVECQHRLPDLAPGPVVGVHPTPDVADHRTPDDHRYPEQHRVHQRAPDAKQEIAFRLPHHVGDQGTDAHREESRHRGLNGFAADQPPDEDQCRHAERGGNRRHQAERRGHRDEHHHRQRRIDQTADAAHLVQHRASAAMGRGQRRVTLGGFRCVACVLFGLAHF